MNLWGARPFLLAAVFSVIMMSPAHADKVIMKDGTVYTGKILVDTDKAVVIGNPPFDPNQYLLEAQDIKTIIYEEYKQKPPAERRRGFQLESGVAGNFFSSSELSLNPALGLTFGAGLRMHPLFEICGGLDWLPMVNAQTNGLSVSDGTTTRGYENFSQWAGVVHGKIYPFFKQKWKWEPYLLGGYHWSRLSPKSTDDTLKGSGYQIGLGVLWPLSSHLFLDPRFSFQKTSYDTINFLGRDGVIKPEIQENQFSFVALVSYRI